MQEIIWVRQGLCLASSYGRASRSCSYDFCFENCLNDPNYTVCLCFLRISAFGPYPHVKLYLLYFLCFYIYLTSSGIFFYLRTNISPDLVKWWQRNANMSALKVCPWALTKYWSDIPEFTFHLCKNPRSDCVSWLGKCLRSESAVTF